MAASTLLPNMFFGVGTADARAGKALCGSCQVSRFTEDRNPEQTSHSVEVSRLAKFGLGFRLAECGFRFMFLGLQSLS